MQKRGLLLDRDGVINVDRGYVGRREHFEFMPGLFPFLRAAQDKGFYIAVLTNQSGVARGLYDATDHATLMAWMLQELATQGIGIELVLTCFESEEGSVRAYQRESFWRKPNPGMVLDAIQKMRINPARSAFLGDQPLDMMAALAGGIRACLWLTEEKEGALQGVTIVRDYDEALEALT
jgi:D-glycero-D-manno-heptose 1,7-bisphosphate phosphatase